MQRKFVTIHYFLYTSTIKEQLNWDIKNPLNSNRKLHFFPPPPRYNAVGFLAFLGKLPTLEGGAGGGEGRKI